MNVFRKAKQKLLGLLRVELESAYNIADMERKNADYCLAANKNLAAESERLRRTNEVLLDTSDYWRKEAFEKQARFNEILREVDGANDLHNLKQVVRLIAFRNEYAAALGCKPGDVPTVIVTDERVV